MRKTQKELIVVGEGGGKEVVKNIQTMNEGDDFVNGIREVIILKRY